MGMPVGTAATYAAFAMAASEAATALSAAVSAFTVANDNAIKMRKNAPTLNGPAVSPVLECTHEGIAPDCS